MTTESALGERIAQLEEQLAMDSLCRQDAEAEARVAAEVKPQFLASMSHELRTPLNGLIGASELALQPVVFDVCAAMADTVARYAPAAAGKGLKLELPAGGLTSLAVEGDALRFCQVLGHLVGNAVKFTDEGSVTVTLQARNPETGTCDLTVCVRDTGIGIRPEDIEHIFRMFSQGDGSSSRAYGGTGLGLAVRILEKTGCRVDVAENGAVAVQMTLERDYAAVFMDLQMPVMDGLQVTRAIRKREGTGPRVPIIAVTANAMPGDRETCLDAGMDDYLAKPLRPSDLVLALHRWCAHAEQPA